MRQKLSILIQYAIAILMPYAILIRALLLKRKSTKWYHWYINFIEQPKNEYLYNFFTNMGFKLSNSNRALIAQTKLPIEVYQAVNGTEMEEADTVAVIEHIMHEKMEGVFNQLVNNDLLDIITLKHLYIGDGIVVTSMSNIFEVQYQQYREQLTYLLSIILGASYPIIIAIIYFICK